MQSIILVKILVVSYFTLSTECFILTDPSENTTLPFEPLDGPMVFMQGKRKTRCYYVMEDGPYTVVHNPKKPNLKLTKECKPVKAHEDQCITFKVTKFLWKDRIIRTCGNEDQCGKLSSYWTNKFNIIWCTGCNGDFCNISRLNTLDLSSAVIAVIYGVLTKKINNL